MSATDRLSAERAFHDEQARQRAATFGARISAYHFDDDDYLDHETWIRPAFAALGDVAGKRVLDLGCGHGMAAVVLARRGACVTGLDLSTGYVREASARARANGVAIDWTIANAERLPFADGSFDAIWGNAILHHLDLETTARELRRILKPVGRAVFCEPWGENRLLNWSRRWLPYPGKERTRDERPLRRHDLTALRRAFRKLEVRGHQLLGMMRRLLRSRRLAAGLDGCDARLLARMPALEQFCRYVVLTLHP